MRRFQDIILSSFTLSAADIVSYVEVFARSTAGWQFPKKQSELYAQLCGKPSCCLVYTRGDFQKSALHLTSSGPRKLYAPNIVPLESSELGVDHYNKIAATFARDLRVKARTEKKNIVVALSKEKVSLRDLIPGKTIWSYFKRYIGAFPLSSHPADIQRLDGFICAVSRYSRRPFDLDAFQHLLVEELGWSVKQARRCRERVEIGLEVLSVYRRFY